MPKTHGCYRMPEYRAWKKMKERCSNPRRPMFYAYGGRGISVCERWRGSFESFLSDLGPRPSAEHSLDRINVNGNYEPGNCRWATAIEQANNTRANRCLTFRGETATIAEWARRTGIPAKAIYARTAEYGWTAEKALTVPGGTPRTYPPRKPRRSRAASGSAE